MESNEDFVPFVSVRDEVILRMEIVLEFRMLTMQVFFLILTESLDFPPLALQGVSVHSLRHPQHFCLVSVQLVVVATMHIEIEMIVVI